MTTWILRYGFNPSDVVCLAGREELGIRRCRETEKRVWHIMDGSANIIGA